MDLPFPFDFSNFKLTNNWAKVGDVIILLSSLEKLMFIT